MDGDLTLEEKLILVTESKIRSTTAYRFCIAYGLSAQEVGEWQVFHHKRLSSLLTCCDKCVLNYHMGRKGFLKELSE
jgi:senataxin